MEITAVAIYIYIIGLIISLLLLRYDYLSNGVKSVYCQLGSISMISISFWPFIFIIYLIYCFYKIVIKPIDKLLMYFINKKK